MCMSGVGTLCANTHYRASSLNWYLSKFSHLLNLCSPFVDFVIWIVLLIWIGGVNNQSTTLNAWLISRGLCFNLASPSLNFDNWCNDQFIRAEVGLYLFLRKQRIIKVKGGHERIWFIGFSPASSCVDKNDVN